MRYPVAERFKAPNGEGFYAGTPTAFVRLMGCSVGTDVCTHCDTDFNVMASALGGGLYTADDLVAWALPYRHVCLTGGEPLDRDIRPLLEVFDPVTRATPIVHVETSGTRHPWWLDRAPNRPPGKHCVSFGDEAPGERHRWMQFWVTVSPKPGFAATMIERVADEVKVILGGLGDGPGWPALDDALRWADMGKLVYVQPRNDRARVDTVAMDEALDVVARHPQLRLSAQLHKYMGTR